MKKKLVIHLNFYGQEINQSFQNGEPNSVRAIFCKKQHKVCNVWEKCQTCPYLADWMQGNGIGCAWEDWVDDSTPEGTEVFVNNPQKEFLRVSKLIDQGILKKG